MESGAKIGRRCLKKSKLAMNKIETFENARENFACYERILQTYYHLATHKYERSSVEFATLNGVSKLAYAFFLAVRPAGTTQSRLLEAKAYLNKKVAIRGKDILRDIKARALSQEKRDENAAYHLVGAQTKEVSRFLEFEEKVCSKYSYPTILNYGILASSRYSEYRSFFDEFSSLISQLEVSKEQNLDSLVKYSARLSMVAESFSKSAAEELQRTGKQILVTNPGNWKNRSIASMCTAIGLETLGFPHGNVTLTGFDESHHIENDVLPICSGVFAYSPDHKRDWEELCKTNSRLELTTKVRLLPSKTSNNSIERENWNGGLRVLVCGHVYNDYFYPFLVNYSRMRAQHLEQKIVESISRLSIVEKVAYKPHPSARDLAKFGTAVVLPQSENFETCVRDFDVAVFPHLKSSVFGHCVENQIPFLAFRDSDVSLSEVSLSKLRQIGGIVDLVAEGELFGFSQSELAEQLSKAVVLSSG